MTADEIRYAADVQTDISIAALRDEALWMQSMLDKARRVCTAAKRHVEWSRQWATFPKSTVGLAPTMAELTQAIDALVTSGEAERG